MEKKVRYITIDGVIETPLSHDDFMDVFLEWLEFQQDSFFGGGTRDITDEIDEE